MNKKMRKNVFSVFNKLNNMARRHGAVYIVEIEEKDTDSCSSLVGDDVAGVYSLAAQRSTMIHLRQLQCMQCYCKMLRFESFLIQVQTSFDFLIVWAAWMSKIL